MTGYSLCRRTAPNPNSDKSVSISDIATCRAPPTPYINSAKSIKCILALTRPLPPSHDAHIKGKPIGSQPCEMPRCCPHKQSSTVFYTPRMMPTMCTIFFLPSKKFTTVSLSKYSNSQFYSTPA